MLDFTPISSKQQTFAQFAEGYSKEELRTLTNEMIDAMLAAIADCDDAAAAFVPTDPNANDMFAASDKDADIAWTLGHVIVHTTASSEESAALAAEMARGVEFHGRSRSEVPWETITTIAQCRQRLEESRRMRLGGLDMWPDAPNLDVTYEPWPGAGQINAVARFILGLYHDTDHLGQIKDIVAQTKAK